MYDPRVARAYDSGDLELAGFQLVMTAEACWTCEDCGGDCSGLVCPECRKHFPDACTCIGEDEPNFEYIALDGVTYAREVT